MYVFLNTSTKK